MKGPFVADVRFEPAVVRDSCWREIAVCDGRAGDQNCVEITQRLNQRDRLIASCRKMIGLVANYRQNGGKLTDKEATVVQEMIDLLTEIESQEPPSGPLPGEPPAPG